MRALRIWTVLTLTAVATAVAQTTTPDAKSAAALITPEDVKAKISYIASDALKGRDTPSPGLEMAAKYIADQFASFGLKPGGDAGTFIQRWPYKSQKLGSATVALRNKTGARDIKFGQDFFVIPSPTTDSLVGEITLVGNASKDVQPNQAFSGKIVAFNTAGGEMNQEWVQGWQPAVIAAIGSGARGVVLVLDTAFNAADIAGVVGNIGAAAAPVPIIGMRSDVAKEIAGTTIELHTGLNSINGSPPNVVGILEGSDPKLKDTYIVYSAHMDHLGVGQPDARGDSIYNGADDDGSGTTAVIELAHAFASMPQRPKRSIIFLTVSGEEKGLFGSKYFTEHPPVPTEKIVADINIDMIGRNSPDTTVAIGQDYSSLGPTTQSIVKAHPELKLVVAQDLWPQEGLFFRSDHFNFAMKKIPAIFFTSGLHKDYHQQSDEPQTIDNDKLARTARLVFWLGENIANDEHAPTWTPQGLKAVQDAGGHD